MELDDIIDDLLEADSGAVAKHDTTYQRRAGPETMTRSVSVGGEDTGMTDTKYHQHRERLAALAAGGRARQYLGKALSVDQVDNMEDEEVEKLYGRTVLGQPHWKVALCMQDGSWQHQIYCRFF